MKIRIQLFTPMKIRIQHFTPKKIRILFLIKVMRICDLSSTDPLASILSLHVSICERPRPTMAAFWASTAPEFCLWLGSGFWLWCGSESGSGFSKWRGSKRIRIRIRNTVLQYTRIGKIVYEQMTKFSVYMPGMATDENKGMVRRIVNMFFIVSVEDCWDSVRGPRLLATQLTYTFAARVFIMTIENTYISQETI